MKNIELNANRLSGIKSLRKIDNSIKPLHLSIFFSICDAIAFLSRMASCNARAHVVLPATGETKAVRTVMNEVGKWVPAKD
jgi:hypothetical protein